MGLGLLVGVIYCAELQRLLTKLCTVLLVDIGFGGPAWSICLTKGQKGLSLPGFSSVTVFLFGSVELLIKMNDRDGPKNRKIELPALWWQKTCCPLLLFLMEVKADNLTNLVCIPAFLVPFGFDKHWPVPCDGTSPWHESASLPGYKMVPKSQDSVASIVTND